MNGINNMKLVLAVLALVSHFSIFECGVHPDGVSKVSREQDALGNYKFSYAVSNAEGEHFREEGTDHLGRVVGTYGLTNKDGTRRVVDYVADKDGFRAEVRSNEPGVASSENGDATLLKLQPDLPLAVAATAIDNSQSAFGTRLNSDISRVTYVDQEDRNVPEHRRFNNAARESRQRNFDDYRPRNPVAYYPERSVDLAKPLSAPAYNPSEIHRRPRTQNLEPSKSTGHETSEVSSRQRSPDPAVESRPLDVYLPPINPLSAVRRPPYIDPAEKIPDRFTTTSRRPFIPPYGGFDDDPLPLGRRPGISMSTIHGGLGTDDFYPPQTSTPSYGAGRYPSGDIPLSRDFIRPRFPPVESPPRRRPGAVLPPVQSPPRRRPGAVLPPVQSPPRRRPGAVLPPVTRSIPPGRNLFPSGIGRGPPGFFGPPYNPGRTPQKFVLRAVPIPNGIQAVRVDPETGRVYERVAYPLYLGPDGYPEYDKNALLLNDDINDDDAFRNGDRSYIDFPHRQRIPFRSARTTSFDFDQEFGNRSRIFNDSFLDPQTLSIPTARDLSWIEKQLSLVEDFDRSRFSNPSFSRNRGFDNGEYPSFNDFDDAPDDRSDSEDGAYSRDRGLNRREFDRNPRHYDRLQPEDTKAIIVSESENVESEAKPGETDAKPSR